MVGGENAAGSSAARRLARAVPREGPGVPEPVGDGGEAAIGVVGAGDGLAGSVDQVGHEAARVAAVGDVVSGVGEAGRRRCEPVHSVVGEREKRGFVQGGKQVADGVVGEGIRRLRRSGDKPVEDVVTVGDGVSCAVGAVGQVADGVVAVGENLLVDGVGGGDETAQCVVGHPVHAPLCVSVRGPVAESIVPEGVGRAGWLDGGAFVLLSAHVGYRGVKRHSVDRHC